MISDVTTVHRSWELHCPEPGPCEAIDGQVLVDGMCPGLCVRGNAEYFLFDCFFCCVEIGSAGQFSSAAKAREHHTCLASMVSQGLGISLCYKSKVSVCVVQGGNYSNTNFPSPKDQEFPQLLLAGTAAQTPALGWLRRESPFIAA